MSCCVCLSAQCQPFLQKNGYQIVRCQRCGFLYVDPRPSQDELDAFYRNPRYFQSGGPYGYAAYLADREEIQRQALERLNLIEQLVPRGRLLDVGCAAGFFLQVAKERGWQVEGVEIAPAMIHAAEQLLRQPVHSTWDVFAATPASFDVVTLWEYLEHVLDPPGELRRVARVLKPGGLLALSTPNAGQLHVRHRPEAWREFKPPEHLSFFTVQTLTALLRACGFEPVLTRGIAPDIRPPETVRRYLDQLRRRLGDRQTRTTPLWWIYSLARRVLQMPTHLSHHLFLSPLDYCQGIEVYARKGDLSSGDSSPSLTSHQ